MACNKQALHYLLDAGVGGLLLTALRLRCPTEYLSRYLSRYLSGELPRQLGVHGPQCGQVAGSDSTAVDEVLQALLQIPDVRARSLALLLRKAILWERSRSTRDCAVRTRMLGVTPYLAFCKLSRQLRYSLAGAL